MCTHLRYEKFHRNAESLTPLLTLDLIFIYTLDPFRYCECASKKPLKGTLPGPE